MSDTSEQNEQMKDRMREALLFKKVINKSPNGVKNTAYKQKYDCIFMQCGNCRLPCKNYTPAHKQITDGGKLFVFSYINGIEHYSNCRGSPYHTEYSPAEKRVVFAQRGKGDGSIGSCYQEEYRTMVKHLKNLL